MNDNDSMTRLKIIEATVQSRHDAATTRMEATEYGGRIADALGYPARREMGEFEKAICRHKRANTWFNADDVWETSNALRAALARDEVAKHE